MRFAGAAYRAHDPRWSFAPLSGAGAALYGGRYNAKGNTALYLALDVVTAVKEISHGFAHKLHPCLLCEYVVDCSPLADLRTETGRAEHQVELEEMNCSWFGDAVAGRRPASWALVEQLRGQGFAGLLTPSFAPGASAADHNLVLWQWGPELPTRVRVHDPHAKLPKDQASWE